MKTILNYCFVCVVILLPFLFSSCGNDIIIDEPDCFEVRLINQICGNAILQVVDPNDSSLARMTWTDEDDVTYQRVFSTILPCNADPTHLVNDAIFKIRISGTEAEETCGRCAAILPSMPSARNEIVLLDANCFDITD